MKPSEHYSARLDFWREAHARKDRQYRVLVRARLAIGLSAVVIAALAFGAMSISPWWLIAPVIVFVGLAIAHSGVDQDRSKAARAIAYYERSIARLGNQ